jgi:hypothetical protein
VAAQLPGALANSTAYATVVQWVPAANGVVPVNAIIGGSEPGRVLPVCRARYKNGVHPGKVVAKNCNFGYGGNEVLAPEYEVLVGNPEVLTPSPQLVRWAPAQAKQIPPGAFIGAFEPGGQVLLICQAPYQGGVHVGKVYAGSCYFGYGGREVPSPQYAVLVVGPMLQPAPAATPQLAEVEARSRDVKAALASLQAEPPIKGGTAGLSASRVALEANTTEALLKLDAWLSASKTGTATAASDVEKLNADAASFLKSMATNQAELQKLTWELIQLSLQSPPR